MEFKSGQPIYSQIIDEIKSRISNGTYELGGRLPSVRDLAVEMGVNPNTMQRALTELERDGLLYSERTNGRFVTEDEEALKKLRYDMVEEYIKEFVDSLRKMGLSNQEIEEAVGKWLKEA